LAIDQAPSDYLLSAHGVARSAVIGLLALALQATQAQGPGPDGGPFRELGATSVTPRVTGTLVEQVHERTITLGGWSITFTAEEALQPFGFHASDNNTGRIRAEISGPGGRCLANGESATHAVLQVARLDAPGPQGYGTIAGECFGATARGHLAVGVFRRRSAPLNIGNPASGDQCAVWGGVFPQGHSLDSDSTIDPCRYPP